jgi:predicted Zn-dependent protease
VLAVQVDRAAQKAAHMTDEEEEKIGDEAWAETARQKQGQISDSGPQAEYVREVGRKLLPGIKRKGISYDFHVVVDDSLNAFALPGGHIAVHTGLLARLENEAQLAGVLGHEIEHVDLKHCIANWALAKELGGEVNDLSFGLVLFFRVPVRSEQEREADARGTELARLAGYSPFQTVTFMERLPPHEKWSESVDIGIRVGDPLLDRILNAMQKQVLDELQNVVDSHPSPAQRACELKQQLFDFMAKEPRRWYFVGKARYANVPPPRAL